MREKSLYPVLVKLDLMNRPITLRNTILLNPSDEIRANKIIRIGWLSPVVTNGIITTLQLK